MALTPRARSSTAAAGAVRAGVGLGVLPDQQPRGARIDREVPVPGFDGGVEDRGVDGLAVRHHQGPDVPELLAHLPEDLLGHLGARQIRLDGVDP